MEEGPEPHEAIERTVEQHHHQEHEAHAAGAVRGVMMPAIAAAVLAVLAALASLLSGHAANQAILKQSQATDQWAFYQAKSTKGHIYEVSRELLAAIGEASGQARKQADGVMTKFQSQVEKYEKEKKDVQDEALALENES